MVFRRRGYAIAFENKINKIENTAKLRKMLDDTREKIKIWHKKSMENMNNGAKRLQGGIDFRLYVFEEREQMLVNRIKELGGSI